MSHFCEVRYFMDITYRGTEYNGWQVQPNGKTIQEEIEKGLSLLLRKETSITGSGRTDTGVHANQQMAHFDAESIDETHIAYKLNSLLPSDIAINAIKQVSIDANARFDAITRKYHYYIHQYKDPFQKGRSYYFTPVLNVEEIQKGCAIIKNWQNFECFSRVHTEVNHFNCEISEINWLAHDFNHLFQIKANRFLRGMVRAIVGTLIDVGLEKTTLDDLRSILESNDRTKAGRAVPAEGLFLQEVSYPEEIYLD